MATPPVGVASWARIPLGVLFAAFVALGALTVRESRRAADDALRRHDHMALPAGGDLTRHGFDRLVDQIKRWTVNASTQKMRDWKDRADLLAQWRAWHDTRSDRAARQAVVVGLLFVGVCGASSALHARRRDARSGDIENAEDDNAPSAAVRQGGLHGLATAVLWMALASWGVGLAMPCLSIEAQYDGPELLGSVSIQTASTGIVDGIVELWEKGKGLLAVLLSFFSVALPLAKLLLMLTAARRMNRGTGLWAHAYEWARRIGKWSMVDVLVVTFVFLQLSAGRSDTLHARLEPGAYFFGAHVLLSMAGGALLGGAGHAGIRPAVGGVGHAGRRWVGGAMTVGVVLVAWGGMGWAVASAVGGWRGADPRRALAWTVETVPYEARFFGDRPFTALLTPGGLPGLSDGQLIMRVRAEDGAEARAEPREIRQWLAGRKEEVAFSTGLVSPPVRMELVLTSHETAGRPWTWTWTRESDGKAEGPWRLATASR